MANKIILKRSNVAGKIPTISDLAVGEISLNMADRLLYYRTPEDTIQSVTIEAGGAGDMLTSVYDTNTNGIVDNAEAINGYNLQVNQNLQTTDNVVFNTITTALNAFDVTYVETGSEAQGSLYWNPDEETLNLKQNGAILQLGQELQVHCRNTSGATISNGTVVMATGSIGNSGRITVSPYSTSVEAKYIVGIATEDILNGEDGKITFDGKIRSLDTSSFSDGDILYVANGGGLTTTQPTGTLREPIAFVINSHSNGTIFVRVPTFPDSYTTTETDNLLDGKQDYDANIVSDASYVHTDNNYTTTEKNKLAGIATNANNYSHPTYAGDDINLDTGALSGALVISDLDFNVTTDTQGHVTDANATYSTRNLTASDVGAAPASHSHSYLPLSGGTLTGVLDFGNVTGRAITITGDSYLDGADASIYIGNAPASYGFDIKYEGTGSGNTNAFVITSTNSGSPKELLRANQDGIVNLPQTGAKVGGNLIFHEGHHPKADKWTTARTLSLTGDVTGSTSFDGSGNASITATVADDSHNHIIANIDGLQTALDGKVDDSQVLTNVPSGAVFTDTETTTNLTVVGNEIRYTNEEGTLQTVDLSLYLDDTNLARIVNGSYDSGNQELVFTRDDATEFRIDASMFFDDTNLVTSVSGKTGVVTLNKSDVSLGNVDNTSDLSKPISTATQTALDGKVDDSQVLTNVPAGAVFTDTLYTHPSHPGDDINVDTGALSGATVISDLDFNVTTDTLGHVTDANATVSTRNLTASDIGAAPASHSHSYLPLSGGTMTGNIIMNDEYIDFKTGGNPTLPQIRGYRGSNDLNTRLLESEGGLAWTTYDSGAANKPSGTTNNANGVLSLNTHGGSYGHQLAFNNSGGFWHRSEENGSIRSWDRVFTDSYHPNADKWTTARTLSLTGDVTGSVSWDGSGNASLTATVADDSHNHTWTNIDGGSVNGWGGLRHSTPHGYIDFGPANTSYAHIYTDRPSFYFNKQLDVLGSRVWHAGNDGSGSGLDADTVDGLHASSFLRSNADDTFSGALTSSSRNAGIFGTYDSTKTDHIWSMGTAYRNSSSGANFGNLYGLAYKHTNNSTGGTMGGGHQMVWCTNGTPRAALGESGIWTAGDLTVSGGDIVLGGTGRIQGIDTVSSSTDAVNKSYVDTAIAGVGGGATGGGSDDIFYENGQTITTSYTITTGKNAMTAGDVTLADGVTVTVPSGSRWVIV